MNTHDHSAKQSAHKNSSRAGQEEQLSDDFSGLDSFLKLQHAAPKPNPNTLTPHTVLQLQRTIGNHATSHMLAQHRLNSQKSTVQRQLGGRSLPRRLERQDVIIQTVGTPVQASPGDVWTTQGNFRWYVNYSLPQPAQGDGYIIQELTIISEDFISGQTVTQHFWELWPVRAGQQVVDGHSVGYDDRFTHFHRPTPGSSGRNRHIGIVRFYEGPCPYSSHVPGEQHDTPPALWTGTGTRHEATAEWDDRPGHPHYNRLELVAGSTIIRLP